MRVEPPSTGLVPLGKSPQGALLPLLPSEDTARRALCEPGSGLSPDPSLRPRQKPRTLSLGRCGREAYTVLLSVSVLSEASWGWPRSPGQEPLLTWTNSLQQPSRDLSFTREETEMRGGTVSASRSWEWRHLDLKAGVSDSPPVLYVTPWVLFGCLEASLPQRHLGMAFGRIRRRGNVWAWQVERTWGTSGTAANMGGKPKSLSRAVPCSGSGRETVELRLVGIQRPCRVAVLRGQQVTDVSDQRR